jgi:hypothetical protein
MVAPPARAAAAHEVTPKTQPPQEAEAISNAFEQTAEAIRPSVAPAWLGRVEQANRRTAGKRCAPPSEGRTNCAFRAPQRGPVPGTTNA